MNKGAVSSRRLNEILKRCKNGAHEDKVGKHAKRARQAAEFRKQLNQLHI